MKYTRFLQYCSPVGGPDESKVIGSGDSVGVMSVSVLADSIAFDVIFGSHGQGSFVYDDDNGGTNQGFTTFILDFSAVDPSLSNIQLSSVGHLQIQLLNQLLVVDYYYLDQD